jgi:hypothetical protein
LQRVHPLPSPNLSGTANGSALAIGLRHQEVTCNLSGHRLQRRPAAAAPGSCGATAADRSTISGATRADGSVQESRQRLRIRLQRGAQVSVGDAVAGTDDHVSESLGCCD